MNLIPVAGIDVEKRFNELAVLSPDNKVCARMTIYHDSFYEVNKAIDLLKKVEKDFASKPIVVMEATGHYHKILFQSF
jgi:transposase